MYLPELLTFVYVNTIDAVEMKSELYSKKKKIKLEINSTIIVYYKFMLSSEGITNLLVNSL